jgi:hypothetical protein
MAEPMSYSSLPAAFSKVVTDLADLIQKEMRLAAASADTAKDATSAVASAEISSFFIFISPLPPNATETLILRLSSRIFSGQFVQKYLVPRSKILVRKPR